MIYIYTYRRKGLQIWAYQIVQATILFNSRFPSYNKQHIQLDPSINFGDISTVQTDGLLISDLSSLVPWLHGSILYWGCGQSKSKWVRPREETWLPAFLVQWTL